jgi:hypothetical protein
MILEGSSEIFVCEEIVRKLIQNYPENDGSSGSLFASGAFLSGVLYSTCQLFCVFLHQATTQHAQEDVVVVVEHEVSEEGMREMKMTPSKERFVS